MSRRGFYTMARGYFDHPMFAAEPFTEREAFQWMIEQAAFEDCKVRVGRAYVDLKRGQLAFATRFLATRWKWSEARVRRFLKRIESDAAIEVLATREATQITICNYDKHQLSRRTDDAQNDAQPVTTATHSRRKEEGIKEVNKEKEDISAVAPATRREYSKAFEEFWKAYPQRKGDNPKAPAAKQFEAAVKQGADPQAIISGVKLACSRNRDKIGTEFIPQAVKWLRDRRWEDYKPPPSEVRAFQPPPGAPSDSELRAKYEREAATSNHGSAEPAGNNPEKLCSESASAREAFGRNGVSDNHTRNAGMRGLGEILRPIPGGPPMGFPGSDRGDH